MPPSSSATLKTAPRTDFKSTRSKQSGPRCSDPVLAGQRRRHRTGNGHSVLDCRRPGAVFGSTASSRQAGAKYERIMYMVQSFKARRPRPARTLTCRACAARPRSPSPRPTFLSTHMSVTGNTPVRSPFRAERAHGRRRTFVSRGRFRSGASRAATCGSKTVSQRKHVMVSFGNGLWRSRPAERQRLFVDGHRVDSASIDSGLTIQLGADGRS